MTPERIKELYDRMLNYITEFTDGVELVEMLRGIGFTDEEIAYEGFDVEKADLVLDAYAYELDLKTGNIKVYKDIFDDFVPNTYINISFVDDKVEGRVGQYKMISEDDEGIIMEYIGG